MVKRNKPRVIQSSAPETPVEERGSASLASLASADPVVHDVAGAGAPAPVAQAPVSDSGKQSRSGRFKGRRAGMAFETVSVKSVAFMGFIMSVVFNACLLLVNVLIVLGLDRIGMISSVNSLLGGMVTLNSSNLISMLTLMAIGFSLVGTLFLIVIALVYNLTAYLVGGLKVRARRTDD